MSKETERQQLIPDSIVGNWFRTFFLRNLTSDGNEKRFNNNQHRFDKQRTTTSQKIDAMWQKEQKEQIEADEHSVLKVRYIIENMIGDAPKTIAKGLRLSGQVATSFSVVDQLYELYGFKKVLPLTHLEISRIEAALIEDGYEREVYPGQVDYKKGNTRINAYKSQYGAVIELKVQVMWESI